MKRNEWVFRYQISEVGDGAKAQALKHRAREKDWQAEYEKNVIEARAAGIDVREFEVTGGKRADVVIDPTVAKRLGESYQKRDEHRRAAEAFEGWAAVMAAQEAGHLDLHHDDVLFFGLGAAPA